MSILFFVGCHPQKRDLSHDKAIPSLTGKIVVFGFRPAISLGDEPGVIRSPLTGAGLQAEPVSNDVADRMSANLFTRLQKDGNYDLISPKQAKGVFSSLVSRDQGMGDMEILQSN